MKAKPSKRVAFRMLVDIDFFLNKEVETAAEAYKELKENGGHHIFVLSMYDDMVRPIGTIDAKTGTLHFFDGRPANEGYMHKYCEWRHHASEGAEYPQIFEPRKEKEPPINVEGVL